MRVASELAVDDDSVVIESVTLEKSGYVAVYVDGGGAPGPLAGVSGLLAAGDSTDVVVEVTRPLDGVDRVWVMLHGEDNGNSTFDFPDADSPLESDVGVLVTQVDLASGE